MYSGFFDQIFGGIMVCAFAYDISFLNLYNQSQIQFAIKLSNSQMVKFGLRIIRL